jgi:DNA polymerase III epsilon subunit-like protein
LVAFERAYTIYIKEKNMILAFCDLETTGTSREKHEIIEVAAVIWDSKEDKIIGEFNEYIKPNARIPSIITEITGITNSMVANSRKSWEVLPEFYAWLKLNNVEKIVGHNFKAFDRHFLAAQVKRYELDVKFGINIDYDVIDTYHICARLNKEGRIKTVNSKQVTLAEYFGIEYNAHRAIEDVRALLQIYKKIRNIDLNLI